MKIALKDDKINKYLAVIEAHLLYYSNATKELKIKGLENLGYAIKMDENEAHLGIKRATENTGIVFMVNKDGGNNSYRRL